MCLDVHRNREGSTPVIQVAKPDGEPRWDKEDAPRIGRGRLILAGGIFAAWIGFLAFFAVQRWFGALQ